MTAGFTQGMTVKELKELESVVRKVIYHNSDNFQDE